MSNMDDDDTNEAGDEVEAGTDIMNDNYRRRRNAGKQRLTNIRLPCIIYSKKDLETAGDRIKHTQNERVFHIEITEEGAVDRFIEEHDIAVICRSQQEQGLALIMQFDHVVEAAQASDAQKIGLMVKLIKRMEDSLFAMCTRMQEQFEGVENKMEGSVSEISECTRKLLSGIERFEEACSKTREKQCRETKDERTQTDKLPTAAKEDCDATHIFTGDTNLLQRSTQEFTVSMEETKIPSLIETEASESLTDTEEEFKSMDSYCTTKDPSQFGNMTDDEFRTTKDGKHESQGGDCIEMVPLKQQEVRSWEIDSIAWHRCVRDNNEQLAMELLKQGKLPDQELLDKACSVFGRTSSVIMNICSSVCYFLQEKSNGELINTWPAYKYKKHSAETTKNQITFVVIKGNADEIDLGNVYRTYVREAFKCSTESSEVIKLEQDDDSDVEDLTELTNVVNETSVSLMDAHSNLTMVSASSKLSKGYNTNAKTIQDTACIVLYAHIKGLVPLREEPFSEQIGNYPVDVREAVFKPFLGGQPNEYHTHLRMGCALRNSTIDVHGNCISGTLGGFIEHPQHGLCCITCGHVLCDVFKDVQHLHNGVKHWTERDWRPEVFQPCQRGSPAFGHLVCAVYNPGGGVNSGVDVALVKIHSRDPIDGFFPDTDKAEQTGFSTERPMAYYNGSICDRDRLKKGSVVIKYGCSTEITRGVFRLQSGAVRTSHAVGQYQGSGFLLHNQIEILSAGEEFFAVEGDSGAFVFAADTNGDLSVIGILEGGMGDGRYIVTPIRDILNALNLPLEGTLKTFSKDILPISPLSDRLRVPNGLNRSSTSQSIKFASISTSDSAISMSASCNEENSSILALVEEKLKATDENLSQEMAKHASEHKLELSLVKADLTKEIQQLHNTLEHRLHGQDNILQEIQQLHNTLEHRLHGQDNILQEILHKLSALKNE